MGHPVEELFNRRRVARNAVEFLAQWASAPAEDIRDAIMRRGGFRGLGHFTGALGAIADFEAADRAVTGERASIEQQIAAVEQEFEQIRQQPPPLPGSAAFNALASRVQQLEGQLPELRSVLGGFDALGESDTETLLAGARLGRRRLAEVILAVHADQTCAEVRQAVRDHRSAAAHVLGPATAYADFSRTIASICGEDMAVPTIDFAAGESWERISRGEEPSVVLSSTNPG